jgi:hypothetical protein
MHWALSVLSVFALATTNGQEPPTSAPVKTPAVCFSRMQITRTVALYEDPSLTPTCFEFELFVNPGKGRSISQYAIQIVSLDPVEDNTGKQLLTADRRRANRSLHERVVATQMRTIGDVLGPTLALRLDIPDAKATTIRRLRGRLELCAVMVAEIEFKNIVELAGKKLEHADLAGLEVSVEIPKDDPTKINLKYNGNRARVREWTIAEGEKYLRPIVQSASGPNDPQTTQSFTFEKPIPKNASLWLAVPKSGEPETAEFDFQDIPLP